MNSWSFNSQFIDCLEGKLIVWFTPFRAERQGIKLKPEVTPRLFT